MKARGGPVRQVLLDRAAAVDRCPIPDHQQSARDLLLQLVQEGDHARAVICLLLHPQEQPAVRRDRANHGEMIVGQQMAQDRRLLFGCPGANHAWQRVVGAWSEPLR